MAIPVVTSPTSGQIIPATRFEVFTLFQCAATNLPTSYAVTGLPTGLAVTTGTGAITGTPTAPAGDYEFTVTATNGDGTSASVKAIIRLAAVGSTPPGMTSGWNENMYLNAILCALRGVSGSSGSGGGSATGFTVPGSAVVSGATPYVLAAGMNSFSVNVTSGTVTMSGAGTEFSGALPAGSYTFAAPSPGFTFPEVTFTGSAGAVYAVIWTHL